METVKCYMLDPQGRRPEKVMTRPRLPQAAIHCPPLVDGNQLGWLVYPNTSGSWEIERRYDLIEITYTPDETSEFPYPFIIDADEYGTRRSEVLPLPGTMVSPDEYEAAKDVADKLFHDIHNPGGAITLTANCWFKTPPGWDSVWMGITNLFDPPSSQIYTVRVQTDWYVGSPAVEMRYQLRNNERLKLDGKTPIGMVVFLPREEPFLEFLPYPPELEAERKQQVADKHQAEYVREGNVLSPYSVWYLRSKRV